MRRAPGPGAGFAVSFLVSYMFVYPGPSRAIVGPRAGRETSMASPGLSSLILKAEGRRFDLAPDHHI
jgi:hypothetical protein